jgi:tRNA-specific 2-thiouridylase
LIFPLGAYTKAEVREIAARCGLAVADKPDSQNFISGDYTSIIKIEPEPGPITDQKGKVLGQHQGIQNYTIGQRKGLDIASSEPLYVTAIDSINNTLIVGNKADIYHQELIVTQMNWISIPGLATSMTASVKIRSSHREAEACLTPLTAKSIRVQFKQPQLAITPGQTAVFYLEDSVLGGGIIDNIGL